MDSKPPQATPRVRPIFRCVVLLFLAAVVVAIAIPSYSGLHHHRHDPGTAAIGALKTIGTSQSLFREQDKDGDDTLDYGTLAELSSASLVDAVLGSGTKQGYLFASGPGTAEPEFLWWATATPTAETRSADPRTFFANHEGLIWYTTTGQAAPITSGARAPAGWKRIGE